MDVGPASPPRGLPGVLLDAVEFLLFAAGFVALAIFAWWHIDAEYHQAKYQREIDDALASRHNSESSRRAPEPPGGDGPFGRLRCPRIGLDVAVVDGLDKTTLRRAAGRLPRNGPNIVVAAHRDTFFRPLREIREGDEISLEKLSGETRLYTVRSIEIVDPAKVDSLRQTTTPILTLITCYPFNWIGPAPKRFIVTATAS